MQCWGRLGACACWQAPHCCLPTLSCPGQLLIQSIIQASLQFRIFLPPPWFCFLEILGARSFVSCVQCDFCQGSLCVLEEALYGRWCLQLIFPVTTVYHHLMNTKISFPTQTEERACWLRPAVLALRRQRQGDPCQAGLGCEVRPWWDVGTEGRNEVLGR